MIQTYHISQGLSRGERLLVMECIFQSGFILVTFAREMEEVFFFRLEQLINTR